MDTQVMDILNSNAIIYQIILTKSDLSSTSEIQSSLESIYKEIMKTKNRHHANPFVHVISSKSSTGINALKQHITDIYTQPIHGSGDDTASDIFSQFDEESVLKSLKDLGVN
jgi:GTP-binding protein EngB required for normal cell division